MFEDLRTAGRRVRRGPLTVSYVRCEGHEGGPLLAFAIGRRFGCAVVRNRARRRLREAFRHAARDLARPVPYALLVQARPAVLEQPFERLVRDAREVLVAISSAPAPR